MRSRNLPPVSPRHAPLILGQVAVHGVCGQAGRGAGSAAAAAAAARSSGKPASKVKRSDPDFGMIVNGRVDDDDDDGREGERKKEMTVLLSAKCDPAPRFWF